MTHEYNLLQSIIILATFRKTFFGALMCTHFYVHHKDDDERKILAILNHSYTHRKVLLEVVLVVLVLWKNCSLGTKNVKIRYIFFESMCSGD